MSEQAKTPATPVQIKLSDVIAMLNAGKTREEIGAHYGLNRANRIRLFQDPSLKGIKTKTGSVFTLEHDVKTEIDKKNEKLAAKEAKAESTGEKSVTPVTETEAKAPVQEAVANQENW